MHFFGDTYINICPIYWLFSSPKGSFNALIYMHRYNPSTVSTVLNEYLREFQAKLDAELANQARIAADPSVSARDKARAEKESDKIRKMLAELLDREAALKVSILYGGSVEGENAKQLLKEGGVHGFLVGRASAHVESFLEILKECK